ncbi:cytochrome P450 [Lyophyllum atratum]|nr:cytochrome P450 [Lyophyllum atratum]
MSQILPILFSGAAISFFWIRATRKKHPPLPPGPPAEPIIGHLRQIPPENQENMYYELGKTYGDVMYLHVLGRPIIVLNSVEAAVDLLDKRSANYSDRPRFVLFELMGWVRSLTFTGYGKIFQKHRRMLHHYLNENKCTTYQPIQTREAHVFLQNILSDETNRDNFIRREVLSVTTIYRFSTAIIIRIAYGHQITSDDDPYVYVTEGVSHALSNMGPPGGTPVDFFPILQYFPAWFPGAYYAGFARDNKVSIDTMHQYPFEHITKEMAKGTAKPSFLSYHLEALNREGSDDPDATLDIQGAAGIMYCAGAETTWSTMSFFFLAMILYPESQAQAQKEIDAVIGSGRLPEFADRNSLSYVECVLQETLRWYGAVPLGVPHRSLEDDIYRGMFIPAGSLMVANTRGMTLDEKVYANPHAFNPSRYLPKPEGNNEPHPNGPFGFGRSRICPGRHLADASLWIVMASILATFNISKAIGDDGKEITPEINLSCGITSQPSPFQCRIRPRNEQAKALIIQADTWDSY